MGRVSQRVLMLSLGALCTACTTRDVRTVDSADVARSRVTTDSASARASVTEQGTPLAQAAGRDTGVEYYTAALLAHIGDSLARGRTTGHTLYRHPTFLYMEGRRASSGVPEVHDTWTDIALVQAGHATLLSGGHVDGGHVESPGEQRGGSIVGGTSRAVGAGDLMVIPAGTPHQFMIPAGDSLRYLTVKVSATPSH